MQTVYCEKSLYFQKKEILSKCLTLLSDSVQAGTIAISETRVSDSNLDLRILSLVETFF